MPHHSRLLPTTLRFCGSCSVTLVCWAVWLVLSVTLCCLIYVALAKELPVPGFVLRRVEAELARANLAITFGRAHLDPTGRILLEDVRLRVRQFEEPLVTSRLVYLRRNFWSVLSGRPMPDEIRLEGATVQLPAMLSPSGTVEPLMRDLALVVRHDGNRWRVDQFAGRIGPVTVTAQGELTVPARPAGMVPLSPDEIAARFLQGSRHVALELHRFDAFDQPVLALQFGSPPGIGNTASVLFTAEAANQPWGQPVTIGPFAVTTTVRLEGEGPRQVRLHAAVRRASYRGEVAVENARSILTAQFVPGNFSVRPLEALIAAGMVTAEGEAALGPVVRADFARWPEVHAAATAQIRGEFLAAEVEAQLQQKSALIHGEGRVSAALIGSILAQHTPRAAPYFAFGDPVSFHAGAVLGPGWRFVSAAGRVDAGRLDSHGVPITAARGRIDIRGESFLADDARVELGENFARGSYWMDFATTDYRMLLQGRLTPPAINGWFNGDWWLKFWQERFAFPAAPPNGDVEVSGCWKEPTRTVFFGQATAEAATVWGGDFERVEADVFLRPHFTHVIGFNGIRAGGEQRLDGWIKRFGEPGTHETRRLEFKADGNLAPEIYGRMLDGKTDELLASLKFTRAPHVRAEGAIDGRAPHAVPDYTFTGAASDRLHYYGFPLESVRVAGKVQGEEIRLNEIEFAAAGGRGAGAATLSGAAEARRLGFDVYLKGADLARTIRAVEEYQVNRTGQKSESMAESRFIKRASGGRLDVALSAEGVPGDLPSFKGNGNAALTGTELAEVHLFGLLSQLLSGFSMNFSSLKLDAARSSFQLQAGRLHFPDLKITGSSAVIDAHGDYVFATSALDFTARFKPFEENLNPLTFAIGIVINPITSILELKLSGPLANPDWSIVVGPSASPPGPKAPGAATPPAKALPPEK